MVHLVRSNSGTLQEILLLRRLAKQQTQSGIDVTRLNKGEERKKKKKKETRKDGDEDGNDEAEEETGEVEEYGLKKSRAGGGQDEAGEE
jgi:hypothetical protein